MCRVCVVYLLLLLLPWNTSRVHLTSGQNSLPLSWLLLWLTTSFLSDWLLLIWKTVKTSRGGQLPRGRESSLFKCVLAFKSARKTDRLKSWVNEWRKNVAERCLQFIQMRDAHLFIMTCIVTWDAWLFFTIHLWRLKNIDILCLITVPITHSRKYQCLCFSIL